MRPVARRDGGVSRDHDVTVVTLGSLLRSPKAVPSIPLYLAIFGIVLAVLAAAYCSSASECPLLEEGAFAHAIWLRTVSEAALSEGYDGKPLANTLV
jgi:hypothetical protein